MTDKLEAERYRLGLDVFSVSASASNDETRELMIGRVGELFADETILAAGGPGWNDPSLDNRDRAIAVLAALVCEGVLDARLDAHIGRAVRAGMSKHSIEILLWFLSLYIGQARTSVAAERVQQIFREHDEPVAK